MSSSQTPRPSPASVAGPEARLVAEAVRLWEETCGAVTDAPAADEVARTGGGDFEARVCARAAALPIAGEVVPALRRVHRAAVFAITLGLAFGIVGGVAAARIALDSSPVTVFWALFSVLGLHTLALLGWVGVVAVSGSTRSGGAASGLIGGAVLALGRKLTPIAGRTGADAAAAGAFTGYLRSPGLARWGLSAISHGVWMAFLLAALAVVVLRLATIDFQFVWETTILGSETYVSLTLGLAALPEALGFASPTAEEIAASRRVGEVVPAATDRAAWSGFLTGCIVAYGVIPRGIALVVSVVAWRRARRRWRLDMTRPGFAVLRSRLMPMTRRVGVVDPDEPATPAAATSIPVADPGAATGGGATVFAGSGPIAIAALEIEPPGSGWPPQLPGIAWVDLGTVEDRAARHNTIDILRSALPPPRGVLAVCDLAVTPDRGTGAWIADVCAATEVPVAVLLTGGQRLRQRSAPGGVERRVADWQRLAVAAGVPVGHVIDADLDHLTHSAARQLANRLRGGDDAVASRPALGAAFRLIVDHAARWTGAPSDRERADLHTAIAALHGETTTGWWSRLRNAGGRSELTPETLRDAASDLTALLPVRLQTNPGWLAAGAGAGALGCVAAAMLAGPAVIAALPAWAGLGALMASVTGMQRPSAARETGPGDVGEAVAAASLFAVVLHLQGLDEPAITRCLDAAFPDPEPPHLTGADAVQIWLAAVDTRLTAALAREPVGVEVAP